MFKKFFKKVGKGIKKLGKAVGKPFKKLFKSKVGKVLGTIGLMLVAPWMAQTVGSWFSGALGTGTATGSAVSASASTAASTAAASGTAAAGSSAASSAAASKTFGNAVGNFFRNIGSKVKTTFNNITEGIKNIFTQGGGADQVAVDAANAGGKAVTEAGASSVDFVSDSVVSGGKAPKIIETEIANIKPPVDTTTVVTDAAGETAIEEVAKTGVEKVANVKDSLLDKSLLEDKSFLELDKVGMQDTLRQDVTATLTEQANIGPLERIGSNVKDFWHGDTKYADLKEKTFRIQPLKNVEALPGFARKATVGEGVLLGQTIAANKVPEPYQAPRVDVSGAFAALSEVDTSGTGIDMIGSNVPSTMAMAQGGMDTTKWMNMTKKHNYIYDASQWG